MARSRSHLIWNSMFVYEVEFSSVIRGHHVYKAAWSPINQVKVTGSRRLENRLVVPGSFLARMTSRAIATKFEEEIIRLKELCTHMDITVEKLRRRPLFL